jgi:ornithine cyclodeaminase/alanine dehydrogenase-like protein (mu-crystallin family)
MGHDRMSGSSVNPASAPIGGVLTRVLNQGDVAGLLSIAECIPVMRAAFAAHHRGRSIPPEIMHSNGVGGEFHIKGGGLAVAEGDQERHYFALKANAGFFGRPERGVPSIRGVVLLFDAASGDLLCVMDSRDLTAVRTAATTGLAVDLLARPDARVATLCGTGTQARAHLQALRVARPSLTTVHVWSRTRAHAEAFCAAHAAPSGMDLRPASELGAATLASDVIVTCTPARAAFLRREHVRPGCCIAAVGADSPDKQEVDAKLTAASRVVADIVSQCAAVGELHHALAAGLMRPEQVWSDLGVLAAAEGRPAWDREAITLYDATGTALQDAAAAALVLRKADVAGVGTVTNFLAQGPQTRSTSLSAPQEHA